MSDIKTININVPLPKVKRERKTKKMEKHSGGEPVPVLSTIRIGGKSSATTNATNNINKKPVLNISVPNQQNSEQKPVKRTTPNNSIKIIDAKKPAIRKTLHVEPKVQIQANKRHNFTRKRKFVSKNITIHIENTNTIKKSREEVARKVKNMSEQELTEKLVKRGLMRPTANPPLQWKQNVMIDIMMFPTRL